MPQKNGSPRYAILALFLSVALGVVGVATWVVAQALSLALSVPVWIFSLVLFFCTTSFIGATIVGMRAYNVYTRLWYRLSAVWIGFFVYLFFFSVAYIGAAALSGPFGVYGSILFFVTPILTSVYGVLHARLLRVRHVEVALDTLPALWEGRRMVWVSDVHLGQLHGPQFAERVVATINAIPHEVVLIGGDLFDGTGAPDLAELIAPFKALTASRGVYFITGNHEEFGPNERFLEAVKSAGMVPLVDEMIDLDGVQIIGVDYQHAAERERFRTMLMRFCIDLSRPSILLKHEPKDVDVAAHAGISMQISGHTHRAQLWPLEYVARIAYRGFAYGLKRAGNMWVYVSSGVGTWGPPMRVATDCEIVVFTLRRRTQ